jgi:hypothetical protein
LAIKVREGGRIVNVACLVAVGVNAEGYREILGTDITTTEDGAGWTSSSGISWTGACLASSSSSVTIMGAW